MIVYSFLQFLKANYAYVLTGLTVLSVLILVLINVFKKEESNDDKGFKSPFRKEKKSDINDLKKPFSFYKVRSNLNDYSIYLTDKKSDFVLKSEIKSSIISLNRTLEDIRSGTADFNVQGLIDDVYEIVLLKDDKIIARSKTFKTKLEGELYIDTLKDIISNSTVLEESINAGFDKSIDYNSKIDFDKFPYKTKIEKIDDLYYSISYDKSGNVCLKSDSRVDKKSIKEIYKSIEKQFLKTNFRIDMELDKKYRFHLLDKEGFTILKGKACNSKEEVIDEIEKSIQKAI